MGNSRKHDNVGTTVDHLAIATFRGVVSGTAGGNDMSGSFVKGTELNAVVTYPSSSNPGYSWQLPTGSVLVTLPPASRYNQVYDWDVSCEPISGTVVPAELAAGTGPSSYGVIKLGHTAASGSFAFAFTRPLTGTSGNAVTQTTVPTGRAGKPAIEWSLSLTARNTDRKV